MLLCQPLWVVTYLAIPPCVASLSQRFARSNSCPPPCTSLTELPLSVGVARDNCCCSAALRLVCRAAAVLLSLPLLQYGPTSRAPRCCCYFSSTVCCSTSLSTAAAVRPHILCAALLLLLPSLLLQQSPQPVHLARPVRTTAALQSLHSRPLDLRAPPSAVARLPLQTAGASASLLPVPAPPPCESPFGGNA